MLKVECESCKAPYQIDERIHQTAVVLDFLARHVPGIRVPG